MFIPGDFFEELAVPMSILPRVLQISVREWCEKREKASERLIKKCLLNILCWIEGIAWSSERDTEFKDVSVECSK